MLKLNSLCDLRKFLAYSAVKEDFIDAPEEVLSRRLKLVLNADFTGDPKRNPCF
jgi:hypothetical protein